MTQKNKINLRFGLISLLILFAALSRLIPHYPNFTALGGMALFGAAYYSKKYWALLIPFIALWISDLLLSNIVYAQYYEGFQWFGHIGVYLAFGLIVLFGWLVLRKIKVTNVILASVGASVIFFLVSNFFVWSGSTFYPQSFAGLMACYEAAVPFFWSTLAGDLFFSSLLFGSFYLIEEYFLEPAH